MFATILHANDGSEPAFKALLRAIELAEQNKSSLHMALVEEVPSMPDFIEEIREATAGRRSRPLFAVPLPRPRGSPSIATSAAAGCPRKNSAHRRHKVLRV